MGIKPDITRGRCEVILGSVAVPPDAAEHRKRSNKTQTLQWRLISFDMLIVGGLGALMHTIFKTNEKTKGERADGKGEGWRDKGGQERREEE